MFCYNERNKRWEAKHMMYTKTRRRKYAVRIRRERTLSNAIIAVFALCAVVVAVMLMLRVNPFSPAVSSQPAEHYIGVSARAL